MRVFFPSGKPDELQFVVIAARHNGRWLFVRHRERDTYEMPGGHIEPGETPLEAAKRELYEESGAAEFTLEPAFIYGVERNGVTTYGEVFFTEVLRFADLPGFETAERVLLDAMPERMTYPQIQPLLMERAEEWLHLAQLMGKAHE